MGYSGSDGLDLLFLLGNSRFLGLLGDGKQHPRLERIGVEVLAGVHAFPERHHCVVNGRVAGYSPENSSSIF